MHKYYYQSTILLYICYTWRSKNISALDKCILDEPLLKSYAKYKLLAIFTFLLITTKVLINKEAIH